MIDTIFWGHTELRSYGSLVAAVRSHGEHEIFEHGSHSIFFWTRITRITRIFFLHTEARSAILTFECWMLNCCGWPQCGIDQWWISMLSQDVLNTRFLNTDVTMNFFEHELREWHEYFWHTDLTDHTDLCSRRCALSFLNTNIWGAHGSYSHFCFHSIFCKKALGM